jgi:hypothetical protein
MNTSLITLEEIAAAYRELAARIVGHAEQAQELLDIADELERVEDLP